MGNLTGGGARGIGRGHWPLWLDRPAQCVRCQCL